MGLLSLLSSEGLAVELPRSGARLFWWRRETQCQWRRPMRCHQVWQAEPGGYARCRLGGLGNGRDSALYE